MFNRPRILAALPGLYPSTIIGVVKPLLQLHQAAKIDLDISFEWLIRRRSVEQSDVVVFCRNMEPQYGQPLDWAVELGKPIIYELDDNLLEVPDTNPGLRYLRAPERQAQLKKYLRRANLIRVYAPALQHYLTSYNPNIVPVNGPLDWSLVPARFPPRDPQRVRLVYATSRLEDEIGLMLSHVMTQVLTAFPQAEFTIWGPRLEPLLNLPRVRHREVIMDYDRFFYQFARQGFDIGLAPLPDDLFHRCKSNNKFREYAACQVAGIYSDTEVYGECVEDGVTGLLVGPGENAWFEAVAHLSEDTSLREHIQWQAQASARQHYNEERLHADWLAHIRQVLAEQPAAGRQTGRVGQPVRAARVESPPRVQPVGLLVGILNQAFRYSFRIVPMLKERGLHVTLGRIRLHLNSFRQFLALKMMLWRLRQHQRSK
ncbi:MAG: glycosyltransferase [Chloroflexi bacterium]|nr:glycosyltransferase [Chloroflexota bacterium]